MHISPGGAAAARPCVERPLPGVSMETRCHRCQHDKRKTEQVGRGVCVCVSVCHLHNDLSLWNAALLVVPVSRQFFHEQTEHKHSVNYSRSVASKVKLAYPLNICTSLSRDELGVEHVCVLQAALLQVDGGHALHLHARAEVSPWLHLLADLHTAAQLPQRSHTLRRRQRHVCVVWLSRQLLLQHTQHIHTHKIVVIDTAQGGYISTVVQ